MKCAILLLCTMLFASCVSYDISMELYELGVRLSGADGVCEGAEVHLRDQNGRLFCSTVDADGEVIFCVPAGIYQITMSHVVYDGYFKTVYNASGIDVIVERRMPEFVELHVSATVMQTSNPVLIKEIYCGGCQMDDGSGKFARDKCVILYNNSSQPVGLSNMALGMAEPYNAEASGHKFLVADRLLYNDEDWLPAINGIWYFDFSAVIKPYSELVINICGAIDNTLSYTKSVNYANSEYYCMYDPETSSADGGHYNNTLYYPSPSAVIPTSHYLKAVKYGKGNAWPVSQTSPALFLFSTVGVTPWFYANDESNIVYPSDAQGNRVYACLRVPREWIVDGVEVFNSNMLESSKKRLTPDIDNGYVALNGGYGHSLIRLLDERATSEAGHNVYKDTNNSSNDFYEADRCSLR